MERIVLAYSGGVDSTVAIRWLAEHRRAEVVALTVDLGQGRALEEVRDRALAAGAVRAHVLEVRDDFARGYIVPSLKADALLEGRCPLSTALGRLMVAQKLVEMAAIEQATAIGCAGDAKGQAEGRMLKAVRALNPVMPLVEPTREWGMTGPQILEFAAAHRLPLPAVVNSPYRTDVNLWGRSVVWDVPVASSGGPSERIYTQTASPADCPNEPASVELNFERGVPTSVNGVLMPLPDLIASLGMIAGAHGVGRIDFVDHPRPGLTRHTVCEAPAAVVLHAAHRELRRLVTPEGTMRRCRQASVEYAALVQSGSWFSPARETIDAFTDSVEQRVTGAVGLKLFKGDWRIVGSRSAFAIAGDGRSISDAAVPDGAAPVGTGPS
jgi:argininosuccinate synthase